MSVIRLLNTSKYPIEENLHCMMVISNPCLYKRRYQLAREFIQRMERTKNVILYIVELAYGTQEFAITKSSNPRHLQLRTEHPLWHKENMINLGVQKLLPSNWKAFAWIDADIEFKNTNWAKEALTMLSTHDVVQLFTDATLLDSKNQPMEELRSVLSPKDERPWQSGFGWAITRQLYERLGGLFPYFIIGGCDLLFTHIFTNSNLINAYPLLPNLTDMSVAYSNRSNKKIKAGYISGQVVHYYHGSIVNRKYASRWDILKNHNYNPKLHITTDYQGLLVPTNECPQEMLQDIIKYFAERNEDCPTN